MLDLPQQQLELLQSKLPEKPQQEPDGDFASPHAHDASQRRCAHQASPDTVLEPLFPQRLDEPTGAVPAAPPLGAPASAVAGATSPFGAPVVAGPFGAPAAATPIPCLGGVGRRAMQTWSGGAASSRSGRPRHARVSRRAPHPTTSLTRPPPHSDPLLFLPQWWPPAPAPRAA